MSRQRGVALAALLAATVLGGCAETAKEVQQLQARAAYERGLTHFTDGQVQLALGAFKEAISLDPSVPVFWNSIGVLYMHKLMRPDFALSAFQTAAELDPTYATALLNVGVASAEMGRWDDALKAYRKALTLPTLSDHDLAYQNLGVAYFNLRRYREAEEALRFAIGLRPDLDAAYYHLGLVLTAENRREDAKAAFRRARELAPQSPFGQAARERLRALGEGG